MPKATEICQEAARLVGGDRNEQHGSIEDNFRCIAALWCAYLGVPVSPRDVAVLMALLKAARMKTGSENPDNAIDGAGYFGIAGQLVKETGGNLSQER